MPVFAQPALQYKLLPNDRPDAGFKAKLAPPICLLLNLMFLGTFYFHIRVAGDALHQGFYPH